MKISRTWLQTYFDDELPTAAELAELFTFHAFEVEGVEEIGTDAVIDVDVLPNRSSDCLSHRGIAHEVAALLKRPLKRDPLRDPIPSWGEPQGVRVRVDDTDRAPRYMAAVVQGVTVGESPQWLKDALASLGQKSINNIVDATNYVMFDLGQPLHAFDLAKLGDEAGAQEVAVRAGKKGETLMTLMGEEVSVGPEDLLIVDGITDTPIGIAGVKGGAHAAIDENTTDILLESAHFNYTAVRKTSQKLKLFTDASVRFQNEPSPELPAYAMRDVIDLIVKIAGGTLEGVVDVYKGAPEPTRVPVSLVQINALLGTELTADEIEDVFARLSFTYTKAGEEYTVEASFERTDIRIPQDVIEEVGRVYGYLNIVGSLPPAPSLPADLNTRYFYTETIRRLLAEAGFDEVYTYTLQEKGKVALANPLASDKAFLRPDLSTGVRKALAENIPRAPLLGLDLVQIFEVGTIFTKHGETMSLAIGAHNTRGKQKVAEDALTDTIAMLERELGVSMKAKLHDSVIEIDLDALIEQLPAPSDYAAPLVYDIEKRYRPWSAYPFVLRDLALWASAKSGDGEAIRQVIKREGGELLVRVDQFDEFTKDGRTSYAYHLVFQSNEKTLTDAQVHEVVQRITQALVALGCELR